jgi:hypothetical protein
MERSAWMTIAFTSRDYHTITIRNYEEGREPIIMRGLSVNQNRRWFESCLRLWRKGLCDPWFHQGGTTFFFSDDNPILTTPAPF